MRRFLPTLCVAVALLHHGSAWADDVLWRAPVEDAHFDVVNNDLVFIRARTDSRWLKLKTGAAARTLKQFLVWDAGKQLIHLQSVGGPTSFKVFATEGGKKLWETMMGPHWTGPTVSDGLVLFTDRDRLFALSSATGAQVWQARIAADAHFSGLAVVADGVVRAGLERADHRNETLFFDVRDGAARGHLSFPILHHAVSRGKLVVVASADSKRGVIDVQTGKTLCPLPKSWDVRGFQAVGQLFLLHRGQSGVLEGLDTSCKPAFTTGVAGNYSLVRAIDGRRILVHTTGDELVARDFDEVVATPPRRRVFRGTITAPAGCPPLVVRLGDNEVTVDKNGAYRIETTESGFLTLVAQGGDDRRSCLGTRVLQLDAAAARQDLKVTCEPREE